MLWKHIIILRLLLIVPLVYLHVAYRSVKGEEGDNHYAVLNISKDCSSMEIKKAYRRLALSIHPDKVNSKA